MVVGGVSIRRLRRLLDRRGAGGSSTGEGGEGGGWSTLSVGWSLLGGMGEGWGCGFVPPYLLQRIAEAPGRGRAVEPDLVIAARETLQLDWAFRDVRRRGGLRAPVRHTGGWVVHSAHNTAALPGTPVRTQRDEQDSGDAAVDEAWDGVRAVLALFRDVYGRASYDGENARVSATVHYQRDYANAFWDGSQLVFGDGDGRIFTRFTKPIDVVGHEFGHGVVEHTAGLVYEGQPGALNESLCDVFAACMKQRHLGQTAAEGDWLVGAGLLMPGVRGRALRSMAEPGTAYDDPVLGQDPQPAHMDDYIDTDDDNGGVHLNSGIPNRAFSLAAVDVGGSAAEGAGRIWYDALLAVTAHADFATFARATLEAAGERHADAVRAAWERVGVVPRTRRRPDNPPAGQPGDRPPRIVEVSRSGGFAGRTTTRTLDLDRDDDRAAEARLLADRVDFTSRAGVRGKPSRPHPDGFVYVFRLGDQEIRLPEQDLDEDLARLARVVLADD